jgi:5-methyltetrahydropteroyltriglutamate--homocysteine methyltransferase
VSVTAGLGRAHPGGVGPGVYDVHSPQVPAVAEITTLLHRAADAVDPGRLWVNPDCGLKTRRYEETTEVLAHMVAAERTGTAWASSPERPGS